MGGSLDLLFTLNANSAKDNIDLEAVLNFLKTVLKGYWTVFDVNAFFDDELLKSTVFKLSGGTEHTMKPMMLTLLAPETVRKFHENLWLYPAAVEKQLQPLTLIISWLRPTLFTFLEQTFLDYLQAKSAEIKGEELILQSSKYEPVYCPEYFLYSHAVDTGSGTHHGIFPDTEEKRRICDCCLGTEELHNDGEAECSLYCQRADPKSYNPLLLPLPSFVPSKLALGMCYNHSLFNETHNSKYQYGCLKENLPVASDCVDLPFSTSYVNAHSVLRYHRGVSASKETWSIVGIIIAIAFVLAVLAIITILLVLRWRARRPQSAGYKVISTEPVSDSSTSISTTSPETIVEH